MGNKMRLLPDPSVYTQLRYELPASRWHLANELTIIKDVANNIEVDLLERSVICNKESQKKLKNTPKYSREEHEEILDEEYFLIAETMPVIIRQSLFIAIYALLETYLNEVCALIQREQKLKVSINDLAGNGIFRAKDYLEKVLDFQFPASHKSWQRISNYNRLRNCFVHACGQITSGTNKQLVKFIESNPYTDITFLKRIELREGFVGESCDSIVAFANDLTDQLLKRFDP
jgi:hypothetical protein